MSDTNMDESPWAYAKRKEAERETQKARAELRDRFAMAALPVCLDRKDQYGPQSIPDAARHAYAVADAMLKARDNKSTDQ